MTSGSSRPATSLARALSSRRVALALTCVLLVVLAIAGVVPQTASTRVAEGVWARPEVRAAVAALALDRILTTWPVALLLAAAAVSMAVATARQIRVAFRRTFALAPRGPRARVDDPAAARATLRHAGFVRTASGDDVEKYVRHPWGYWGGVVLHLGLLLTVAAGLALSLTEWRGIVRLAEGESFGPASRFAAEQHGFLANGASLPETFTVAASSAEYWPDNTPRQVETTLTFASEKPLAISVNGPADRGGVRYYQSQAHGHAFLVTLVREDGSVLPLRLDMSAPASPADASYFGAGIPDGNRVVRAKYFLDASKRSMNGVPLLTLRLEKDGAAAEQAVLRPGETAPLGPYDATLVDVVAWTELIVVRDEGVPLLFLGFVLVVAGSALIYLTPPAAVHLIPGDDGRYDVTWEPSRFARRSPPELSATAERNGDAA